LWSLLVVVSSVWCLSCDSSRTDERPPLNAAPTECAAPVGDSNAEAASDAAADSPDLLRLAFYTDVQATEEWGVPEAMTMAAAAINAVEPDLVIAGGDLILGGFSAEAVEAEKKWGVYAKLADALVAPVHAAIGNHDLVGAASIGAEDAVAARRSFLTRHGLERSYYSFDYEGRHLIVLDTVQIVGGHGGYEGGLDEAQREWLLADLRKVGADTPVILVSHMPLLTVYPVATRGWLEVPDANRVIQKANELLDMFAEHRLELVLQGHLHAFERIDWRGTTFVTGGSVSGDWWRGPHEGTPEGFTVIEFDGDEISVRYESYGWRSRR
jgi:3',5'-cyclic AMP phosphodiesterase CpdA